MTPRPYATEKFIRRFLIHVLPTGFHHVRHYGLFAGSNRVENIVRARQLLNQPPRQNDTATAGSSDADEPPTLSHRSPVLRRPQRRTQKSFALIGRV